MSDELAIGGPNTTSVVTTELAAESWHLERLAAELAHYRAELSVLDRLVSSGMLRRADAPLSALAAERAIDEAEAALSRSADTSAVLARALALAAEGYSFAEYIAAAAAQRLAAVISFEAGYLLPVLLPALALVALPVITAGAPVALAYSLATPQARKGVEAAVAKLLWDRRVLLSDPHVVELVRLSVMSADDFGGGVLRVPPAFESLLGDEGFGVLGLDTSAAAVVAVAAGSGALRETPVTVTGGPTVSGGRPAEGFEDRADRIPTDGAQIRIDRYREPGHPDRFEVYLGGTLDFSPTPGKEVWDMTSNVVGIAGGNAGAYRAAQAAMKLAGITANSSVVFTGYSQGGLIAARLAASGRYRVAGLFTLGAPAGQVAVPKAIPYVAIEHAEDVVPALGGTWASSRPVLVRRQVFDAPPTDSEYVFPAHQLTQYRHSAALLDRAGDPRVRAALDKLGDGAARAVAVESTLYRATRVGGPG